MYRLSVLLLCCLLMCGCDQRRPGSRVSWQTPNPYIPPSVVVSWDQSSFREDELLLLGAFPLESVEKCTDRVHCRYRMAQGYLVKRYWVRLDGTVERQKHDLLYENTVEFILGSMGKFRQPVSTELSPSDLHALVVGPVSQHREPDFAALNRKLDRFVWELGTNLLLRPPNDGSDTNADFREIPVETGLTGRASSR